MPLPHRSSPRRRERRSRSRSHSPRRKRSSSRSRDRRRSRSPQRRRSPERKNRSPPRRKSPSPRRRSRSPKRRSRSQSPRRRSRSHSPRRKGHSPRRSPSPGDRNHPVKRPADSSGRRPGLRSRTPSPTPIKKSRDERLYEDEVPYKQQQQRRSTKQAQSPIHESQYGGKMYADQPSSSKQPLFPSGSSKRNPEIDYVTIVEKGPKKQKLNERFETLEQVAHGHFEFEENITIGIHRGPQHIELDDDDDIEVNYDFNPKTFKMLFPKKNYVKEIFDRDEIKAFHHDDILDEEAYVEKRTISIKPVDKPKSRKYDEELDYKITVGSSREGYGDRRMVQDSGSGSRSRPSRSSLYDDVPVTVRLDPKPDPRYEKIYRDQQRYEDRSLIQETVHRNPNDLRYNLMRRKSDGDRDGGRDGRERQSGHSAMMDARSRIEARRQGNRDDYSDRRDRSGDRRASQGSPPRRIERKKANVKTDLPDFKNRPGVKLEKPVVWVIGSSVVKDLKQFGEVFPDYDIWSLLKEDVSSLVVHGELDMKIEDILPAVKYLLKNNQPPQMIVLQCGELNVSVGRNVDIVDNVKKDLATIKELVPGVVMVWSQILPPWMVKDPCGSTLAKSRRRINTFMMKCFLSDEVGGCFLYHNLLRTDLITKYHMPTSDGHLHLKKAGMYAYIYEMKTGIKYLMTGHGSIFPFLKWPMNKSEIEEFDPQHMCMLNAEHIQSLDADTLGMFSKEQIQMLSNDQILMFHIGQFPFVYCEDFVQKLSPKQLSGLSKENFLQLTSSQIKLFTEIKERAQWMSEELVKLLRKRIIKKERGEMKKKKKAELDTENAEKDGEMKESTLGDLMGSSESEDDDSSMKSEREWVVENKILAPLYVMEDKSRWKPRGGSSYRGRRPFRGRGGGRGRGRGLSKLYKDKYHWHKGMTGEEAVSESTYREQEMGRSRSGSRGRYERSRDRYRSNSREGHWRSRSRDRYRSHSRESYERSVRSRSNRREGHGRSKSSDRYRSNRREGHGRSRSRDKCRSDGREGHERSRSRDRYSSNSSEGHGRSKSRDRYRSNSRGGHERSSSPDRSRSDSSEGHRRSRSTERYRKSHKRQRERSHSSEKRYSHREHGSLPVQIMPFPGQYPVGMMPQYGMPSRPFPPMPFPVMHMPPRPFPPVPFPGAWPRVPFPIGAPVPQPPGVQPSLPAQPQEQNWGDSPSVNVTSINTSNLTQIN